MSKSGIKVIILFLTALLIACPAFAKQIALPANTPATVYYTTNGAAPATTTINATLDATASASTMSISGASMMSANAFDAYYTLASTTTAWDGTDADRLKLPTADYASTYGDEASVTYTLPWTFSFYGETFTQITADTNGNIWFGSTGSAHSFNLANTGRSPVIAAWNNDLSSYLTGGVFIQHKSSPERIVIEWQTETYTDEGRRRPHNFEVVLFQTGEVRLDYGSFTTSLTNVDLGSGVSFNDGYLFINLTANAGSAYSLGGQSFLLTVSGSTKTFDITFPTGSYGSVASNVGVTWSASSVKTLPSGTHIVLQPIPMLGYKLNSWGGVCSGTGTCSFVLSSNAVASANFAYDPAQTSAVIFPTGTSTGYYSFQSAYNASTTDSIVKLRAVTFSEAISFNLSKSVTIKGGYNGDYTANNAGQSIVVGSVIIAKGVVVLDRLIIR